MKTLYKTLVRPHLEYANCIWNPVLHKDVLMIERVQRRASKILPSMKEVKYVDRLRHLKLPTLAYRRVRGDLIQVYKIVHGLSDIRQDLLFKNAQQDIGTRGHSYKFQKQHSRLRLRENSFSIRIVNTWNSLPDQVVCAKTVNEFKIGIDAALSLTHDMYTWTGPLWQSII